MYTAADMFRHDWHGSPNGANIACNLCHNEGPERGKATAKSCRDCHLDLQADTAADTLTGYMAISYVEAMHQQCLGCHQRRATDDPSRAVLVQCPTCHTGMQPDYLATDTLRGLRAAAANHVLLPGQTPEATMIQEAPVEP